MDDSFRVFLSRAMKYCSRKEVCVSEISEKLKIWGVEDEQTSEKIIKQLIEEKFIDEQRFADAFTMDKFKFYNWGKTKIKYHLKRKKISEKIIQNSLAKILDDQYIDAAAALLEKKAASIKNIEPKIKKQKLYNYLISKGFEPDIFYKIFDKI